MPRQAALLLCPYYLLLSAAWEPAASLLEPVQDVVADGGPPVLLLQVNMDVKPADAKSTQELPPYWSGKNGDAMRSGASPHVAPSNLEVEPTWSWHTPNYGVVRAAPLIDGDLNIYVATIHGEIYKFSASGEKLWTFSAGTSIPEVPALLGRRLIAATHTAEVFSLDTMTGVEQWRTKVTKNTARDTWSVTAADGVVVVAVGGWKDQHSGNLAVTALDAEDGHELWTYFPDVPLYNFMASVFEGRLHFSDMCGKAYALRLADGVELWKRPSWKEGEEEAFNTGGAIVGPGGVVYVTANVKLVPGGNKTGRVRAHRSDDGRLLWSTDLPYEANNAAAVGRLAAGGPLSVVVGTGENPEFPPLPGQPEEGIPKVGQVVALDAATGALRWTYQTPTWHDSAAGDSLLPYHICLPDSFSNPTIGGDGTVYLGYEDGHLYAFKEATVDGRPEVRVSSADTRQAFQGSAGIAPGMLVATPCDGLRVWRF